MWNTQVMIAYFGKGILLNLHLARPRDVTGTSYWFQRGARWSVDIFYRRA